MGQTKVEWLLVEGKGRSLIHERVVGSWAKAEKIEIRWYEFFFAETGLFKVERKA